MGSMKRVRRCRSVRVCVFVLALVIGQYVAATAGRVEASGETTAAGDPSPNILFNIMDDVGIDQMRTFGYGEDNQPRTPTIDTIARAGVRFRNAWAMPE